MSVVLKGFRANQPTNIRLDSATKPSLFYYFNDAYVDEARGLYERLVKRGDVDWLYLVYISTSTGSYDPFFALARSRIYWSGPERYRSSICSGLGVTGAPFFVSWREGQVTYKGPSRARALQALRAGVKTDQEEALTEVPSPIESPLLTKAECVRDVVKSYIWTLEERVLESIEKTADPLKYYQDECARLKATCEAQRERIDQMQRELDAKNTLLRQRPSSPIKSAASPRRLLDLVPVLQQKRQLAAMKQTSPPVSSPSRRVR